MRLASLTPGVVALLLLGGCGGDDEQTTSAAPQTATQTSTVTEEPAPAPTDSADDERQDGAAERRASRKRAVAIARKRTRGGRVTDVERGDDGGREVWEVEIERGAVDYDVTVAVRDGKILEVDRDNDDDD